MITYNNALGLPSFSDILDKVTTVVDKYKPIATQAYQSFQDIQSLTNQPGQPAVPVFNPLNYQVTVPDNPSAGLSSGTKVALGIAGVALVGGVLYLLAD